MVKGIAMTTDLEMLVWISGLTALMWIPYILIHVLNNGTIDGDVIATSSVVNNGIINGTVTTPSSLKGLPEPWVFDMYKEIATPISFPGTIDKQVLAPGLNPWGALNSNGVYFIDASNATLIIRDSRIHGTLVVKCGIAGLVRIEGAVRFDTYHHKFPALIVDGDVELVYTSDVIELDEALLGTNFNPPGAPWSGNTDSDQSDVYECQIGDLTHIKGQLLMQGTAEIDGVLICDSTATLDGNNEFNYEDKSLKRPPYGYTEAGADSPMVIVPGSWKHIVD